MDYNTDRIMSLSYRFKQLLLFAPLLCLLLFLHPANVKAQTPVPSMEDSTSSVVWSLQDCLNYAARYNINLNTLRLTKKTSEQDLILSKAAKLPNLNATVGQNFTGGKNVNESYVLSASGNYSINSNVTLYNGGFLNKDIQQKNLLLQIADLNVDAQMNDITLLITQAYLNILLAKENIVYVKDVVTTSQAQVAQAQQQYDVGSLALVGLVQLQAQLANDKFLLVTAENTRRQNLLTLKQILQLPTSKPFDIISPDTLIETGMLTPVQEAQQQAFDTRPEIKTGNIGVDVAKLDLEKAKTGYLPVLTAGGALASNYATNISNAYLKQLDNNFYQQIGLTLSVPIFTRKVNKTNVEKAKIEVDQSNLNLQNTKVNLSQTVEQAYINVLNAQSQYDAAVEQYKYNQESYRIANETLKIGAANIVQYLQQKNLYIQALQSYIQAKYNAALTIRIYDFYRGIPVKL
ncbi:TolC family protein [Chitinophaga sp. Hz27]|uniref:TolC family protein n=1 Tax=Chitinophaga sp. Hz27 TaxID=3347169 RepID=UPI0035D9C713